jgi:hypothetical protein
VARAFPKGNLLVLFLQSSENKAPMTGRIRKMPADIHNASQTGTCLFDTKLANVLVYEYILKGFLKWNPICKQKREAGNLRDFNDE